MTGSRFQGRFYPRQTARRFSCSLLATLANNPALKVNRRVCPIPLPPPLPSAVCILRENRIIIAKSIWRSRLFVSVFTRCRRLSNVPLSRTQPTVVTRRIVYSRNNQHCLCAPLHIQVYNAVYTALAVCIPDARQAAIRPLPASENSRCNNGTLLADQNGACEIDCNGYSSLLGLID